ncbi:MAG: DUF1553 domain-containing protein [Tepidisphaeraceae bacterium]
MSINLDFRSHDAGGGGSYRLYTGQADVGLLAVEIAIAGNSVAVRNGERFQEVRKIKPGAWYNLQLALNLEDRTYSGSVGAPGDLVTFRDIAFSPSWSGTISGVMFDGTGPVPGNRPAFDIDNLAVQDAPFDPPLATAPTTQRAAPVKASAATLPADATAAAKTAARLAELDAAIASLLKQRKELIARLPYDAAYGVREGKPTDAVIQIRGEPKTPGAAVPRGFLKVLGGQKLPPDHKGSGRLELAGWLAAPQNPLTARVMVNRIWQHHFGRGIVATPNDFGTRGAPPTHPELLDSLALRFVADGWSVKAMHREIMRSSTYQMSASAEQPAALEADPDDRLLWRFPRRRLEAEAIRDAMRAVAGTLDSSPGGAHPFPAADTWAFSVHNPFYGLYDTPRRSVYLMVQRQKRHPFLSLFDAADPNVSTDERQPTVTPAQALYLMNAPFVHEQSAALATRLLKEAGGETERIRLAFELTQTREPDDADIADAAAFLRAYGQSVADLGKSHDEQEAQSWGAFSRVLLTGNGFLYVD